MAEDGVFHEFVSSIPDDPTFQGAIQPQTHWNGPHIFTGGQNGQFAIRDSLAPSGFRWSDLVDASTGRILNFSQGTQTVTNVNSPTGNLVSLAFNVLKASSQCLIIYQYGLLDTGTAAYRNGTLSVFLDTLGVIHLLTIPAVNVPGVFVHFRQLSVGSHTLAGRFTSTTPTLSGTLWFYVLEIG